MLRIDAHQHFWHYDPVRDGWIGDDMKSLRRDFLPAHLEPLLQANGFDGCVAVQADQSEAETEFLCGLAAAHPFIKAVVGWVDLRADDIAERLERFEKMPVLKGFRHILQGEPTRDLMLQPRFQQGLRALGVFNYTYDVLVYPDQLCYLPGLLQTFPQMRFVLDHLGKPPVRSGAIDEWAAGIRQVAAFPNFYCKLSGMVTEADWQQWKPSDLHPYLDTVVEAFGTERLLYGSDWPVCLVAADYERQYGVVAEYFKNFSAGEQEAVFGGNACRFYQIND